MVALKALKTEDNPDYKASFQFWAAVWRQKAAKEFSKFSVQSDVHSPYELRANIPIRNFKEFYDTFDVKMGDKIYLEPEKRLTIW